MKNYPEKWLLVRKDAENRVGIGTLFCHEWDALGVSEALVDTTLIRKMRSTIWDWSRSLRSSKNHENIGNTLKKDWSKSEFQEFRWNFQYPPPFIKIGLDLHSPSSRLSILTRDALFEKKVPGAWFPQKIGNRGGSCRCWWVQNYGKN